MPATTPASSTPAASAPAFSALARSAPEDSRRLVVTSALPYANGDIHLGHLVEYIQTDIFCRAHRSAGHVVTYLCADDTHGTPIMLRAEREGISPEALIARSSAAHQRDFAAFGVAFDHYGSTHSADNQRLSADIYRALDGAGLIARRTIAQMFDPERQMFLPDRFIKGGCPKCKAPDQYGDNCEACGATYSPTDLISPKSAVSGATPVTRDSEHHFFALSDSRCQEFLRQWALAGEHLQPEAANKMREWLDGGLSDWDISRDAPYFGFEIPGAPGKFFYVWLDAPVGYLASLAEWCRAQGEDFQAHIAQDSKTELIHFIGKDILYFHSLFWPAMLKFAGLRTPSRIFAHGFLTVDGAKMSKSRGTFITAESYIAQGLNPEWLRYYFASKLNGSLEDLDLSLTDFIAKVNSDLVGKYANIASRSAGFLRKRFAGRLLGDARTEEPGSSHAELEAQLAQAGALIWPAYESRDTARAVRDIGALMDAVNGYVDHWKPWELAKQEGQDALLHRVLTTTMRCFARLTILLAPILPATAKRVASEVFAGSTLNTEGSWKANMLDAPPVEQVGEFGHLITRIDPAQLEALLAANRENLAAQAAT